MRIGIIAPPWFPVPPPGYGGIEAIVSLLVEGLAEAGVEVTLFASGDSRTTAELDYVHAEAPSERIGEMVVELEHVLACLGRADDFDLIHDHSGLLAVTLAASVETPFLHTVHGPLTDHSGHLYRRAVAFNPCVSLVSLTDAQRRPAPELPWLRTCPNAIDVETFPYRTDDDGYLAFLGRMSEEKGAREAIGVADAVGMELRIAAKCREPLERAYFEAYVAPHIGNGVEYLGELGHADKTRLLAGARAVLCPINWEEPFGLVLIEAAACGTPVVANRRGSVPELVVPGVTGMIVDSTEEMPAALAEIGSLDRAQIRAVAEERFSPPSMIGAYLDAYVRLLEQSGSAALAAPSAVEPQAARATAARVGS